MNHDDAPELDDEFFRRATEHNKVSKNMTREDIIRMARGAGVPMEYSFVAGATVWDLHPSIERFAALVAAATCEKCAAVCDSLATDEIKWYSPNDCAEEIRKLK